MRWFVRVCLDTLGLLSELGLLCTLGLLNDFRFCWVRWVLSALVLLERLRLPFTADR